MKVSEVQSKIYVAINAWHYTGRAMSDSHSSTGSQHLHTDGRAHWMSWQKAAVYTHTHKHIYTHTPLNTDQQNVVHQGHNRENYGLA